MNRLFVVAVTVFFAACGRQMSVEVASPSLRVPAGGQAELTLSLHDAPGEVAQLTLEPAVAGVSVFPTSLSTSSPLQNLIFSATPQAVPGVNHVALVVTAGAQKKSLNLDLEVIDAEAFVVSMSPPAVVVRQGQSVTAAFTVKNAPLRSVTGTVTMTVEGAAPTGVELTAGSISLSGDAAVSGTLKATATAAAAVGMKTLDLVASQGSRRTRLTFQVVVIDAHAPDFTLDVPAMAAVRRGGQASVQVKVTALMGFAETVSLTTAGLPAGITVDPATATATASSPATLTIRADASALGGMSQLSIIGAAGNLVHQARVMLRVTDSGTVDTTFGNGGLANLPALLTPTALSRMVVMPDGKIVAVGPNGSAAVAVRFTADGSVDTTFGQNGLAPLDVTGQSDSPLGIAQAGNGAVVIAIYALEFGTTSYAYVSALVKLKEDGTPDLAFGNAGTWENPQSAYPYAVTALSDGSFAVAETRVDEVSGAMTGAITRVTAAGVLDLGFGSGGSATFADRYAVDVAQLADGSLVALMGTVLLDSVVDPQVTKLTPLGQIDGTFGSGGTRVLDLGTSSEGPYNLAVKPSGAIDVLTLGYSDAQKFSDARVAVFQLTPDGELDGTFGTGGKAQVAKLIGMSMRLAADGSAILGGCTVDSTGMQYHGRLARLTNGGTVDSTLSEGAADGVAVGPSSGGCVFSVGVASSGRIIAAGNLGARLDQGWFITRLMP